MKLHSFFRSSAAYRVRIALAVKGLAYDTVPHHLRKGEQREPEYRALNPQALVPTLEDGGHVLTQSLAIIEYLEEAYPQTPRLLPSDPAGRAVVRAMSQAIACDVHPLNNLRVLDYLKSQMGQSQEATDVWYRHWIAEGFAMMEGFLAREKKHGKHVFRDQVTMADCCLVPQVANALLYKCDVKPYPAVMRVHEACMKLDAFIKAQPSNQPDAA